MQLNAINLLLGAANGATAATASSDGAPDSNLFAQMLGDGGQGGNAGQYGANPNNALIAANQNSNPAAALLAGQQQSATALNQLLQQTITPEDATKLLAQIDALQAQNASAGNADDEALFQQMKDQLQQIQDSGEARTLASMLEALPKPTEEPVQIDATENAVATLAAPTVSKETPRSPAMQRMLQWLQGTLGNRANTAQQQEAPKQVDQATDEVAQAMLLAASQALPASGFPVAAEVSDDAPKPAEQTEETTEIVTTIVPLAQSLIVAQQVTAQPVQQPLATRPDIDEALPSLSLAKNDKDALPEVELPQADLPAQADANKKMADSSAGFYRQLQVNAHGDSPIMISPGKADTAKDTTTATAINDTPVNGLGAVTGHGVQTQTANAVQATATTAPTVLNHVPVSEQVHVAISRGVKDNIDHLTIQLDPEGLGRVEVKMHTDSHGQTQLSFTVDKAETFDALSRDARSLERSLQEAGIKADTGSMQFNMRQQPQQQADLNGGQSQYRQPDWQENASNDDGSGAGGVTAASSGIVTRNYTLNIREGVDIHA